MIKLLTPHPALIVESGERVMLVADLHLGLEFELDKHPLSVEPDIGGVNGAS